jgi:hypothetical protein
MSNYSTGWEVTSLTEPCVKEEIAESKSLRGLEWNWILEVTWFNHFRGGN